MKKFLYSFLLLGIAFFSSAQCDPSLADGFDTAFYPDPETNFVSGCVGQPYEQYVYFKVPTDTVVNVGIFGDMTVQIVHIRLDNVQGLPPGLSIATNPANGIFPGGSLGCGLISGTPTTAGTYDVTINVIAKVIAPIVGEMEQADSFEGYQIVIENCIPECDTPSNLVVSNVTTESADATWSAGGTETVWEVNYGASGFNPNTGGTSMIVTTTNYTITGLNPETNYDVYVRALCDQDVKSEWTSTVSFTTDEEEIVCDEPDNIIITGITENAASVYWVAGGSETSWEIVYGLTGFNPNTGGTSDIVSTTVYTITGLDAETTYDVYVRAICDANNMSEWSVVETFTTESDEPTEECNPPTNVFVSNITEVSAEILWSSSSNVNSWEVAYGETGFNPNSGGGTIVPVTSPTYTITGLDAGTTYDVYVRSICDGPEVSDWSVVKTFTTNEEEPPADECDAPTEIAIENVTSTSAEVAWEPSGEETEWEIVYGPSGFNPNTGGTSEIVNAPVYTLTGLDPETTYDVYVRAICDEGLESDWSSAVSFATPEGEPSEECDAPTGLFVDGITNESADVSWTAGSNETSWEVVYGPTGFNPNTGGTSVTVGSTNYTITGLDAETTYDVYVRAICDEENSSDWSDSETFTTLEDDEEPGDDCIAPTDLVISNVTETTADISWQAGGNETMWAVLYGPAGFDPLSEGDTEVASVNPAITLTGLEPGTAYDVYVVTVCDIQNLIVSDPITGSFTTLEEDHSGLSEFDFGEAFTMFPNPATSEVTISNLENNNQVKEINFFNAEGKKLVSMTTTLDKVTVSTETLPAGIYFVKVKQNDSLTVQKLIVR